MKTILRKALPKSPKQAIAYDAICWASITLLFLIFLPIVTPWVGLTGLCILSIECLILLKKGKE